MAICQRCWKYTCNRAELSLYEGQWLCQPCIRAGQVVGGHKSKGVESLQLAPDKLISEVIATMRKTAPRPLPIGEHKRANPRLHGEGIPQPTSCAPQWRLLPALCLTTTSNGKGEPDWARLKQLPLCVWENAIKQVFGGWPDPEYRTSTNGKRLGPYLYWRWHEGKITRSKYLGVMR